MQISFMVTIHLNYQISSAKEPQNVLTPPLNLNTNN